MITRTIRNIPEDVYRAIRIMAAERGTNTNQMILDILDEATKDKREKQ